MSSRDHTYDLVIAETEKNTADIFDQHVYKHHRLGARQFRLVALAPPPESFVFTKEQIMNVLRLCYSAGVETELERQLRHEMSSHLPPDLPDQS